MCSMLLSSHRDSTTSVDKPSFGGEDAVAARCGSLLDPPGHPHANAQHRAKSESRTAGYYLSQQRASPVDRRYTAVGLELNNRRGLSLTVGCIGLLVGAHTAHSQRKAPPRNFELPQPGPAYQITPAIDLPVIALGAAIAAAWYLREQTPRAYCAPLCDDNNLPFLDEPVAGRWAPGWSTSSDVAALSIVGGSIAAHLLYEPSVSAALNDSVVLLQVWTTTSALQLLTATGVRRPRPYMYGTRASEQQRTTGHASLSFFSGHTANAFATVLATYSTLSRLRVAAPHRFAALGLGLGIASFVGAGRIISGNHFPTDVIAGAIVGSGLGILIPRLHDSPVRIIPGPNAGIGIAVRTDWLFRRY